jgi:hypothetical protein
MPTGLAQIVFGVLVLVLVAESLNTAIETVAVSSSALQTTPMRVAPKTSPLEGVVGSTDGSRGSGLDFVDSHLPTGYDDENISFDSLMRLPGLLMAGVDDADLSTAPGGSRTCIP